MVIDQPRGLHMGVDNGRADKGKPPSLEVFADDPGEVGLCRDLFHAVKPVYTGRTVNKTPDVVIKRTELLLNVQKRSGIRHGGADLSFISDDTGVRFQALDILLTEPGN